VRLHAQGLITCLARGSGPWVIVPPEHADRGAQPVLWWLHDFLSKKEESDLLALLSAAQAHRSSRWVIFGCFFAKQSLAQSPTVRLSTEKSHVRVGSKATTLLDLLRRAPAIGGVDRAALILGDLAPKLDPENVTESLSAASDVAAAQRFGYLLDLYGHTRHAHRVDRWLRQHRT
jgi:AbiEi antitoxin C-terminal domain